MVRIGIVTAADSGRRMARVKFPDMDCATDWLHTMKLPEIGDRAVCADIEGGDDNETVILGVLL